VTVTNYRHLFLCVLEEEEEDNMATHHCLLLWWCFSEESDGSLLPSPSSLVMLRFNLVVFG